MSLQSAQPRRVLSAPMVSDLVAELAITKQKLAVAQAELSELRGSPLFPGIQIHAEVARKHSLTVVAMLKPRRGAVELAARDEAIWRMYHETGLSLPQIGKVLDRDHTTILHSLRKTGAAKGQPAVVMESWAEELNAALTAFLAGDIDSREAQRRTGKTRQQLIRRSRHLGLDTSKVMLGPTPNRWSRNELALLRAHLAGNLAHAALLLRLPGRKRVGVARKLEQLRGERS